MHTRLLLLFILLTPSVFAQHNLFETPQYPFLREQENCFQSGNDTLYNALFQKLTTLGLKGEGKINIVHIGDSHIQADFFSGTFRKYLQSFFLGAQSGRGFIFPYKLAKTNNPLSYTVSSNRSWEACKNIDTRLRCTLGLAGIAVTTYDAQANIKINISDASLPGYDFDRLMVFHDFSKDAFTPVVSHAQEVIPHPENGYTLFTFKESQSRLNIHFQQDSSQNHFTLHGLNFDTEDPGILYHTIGVNGARVDSYLKCQLFEQQLQALQADWVLVSLGTNDVYTNVFDSLQFARKLDLFIRHIQAAAPKAAILLCLPGDHLMKRSYDNPNLVVINRILKQKARAYGLSYWDYYSLMGGAESIRAWRAENLAHTDYLHYTQAGYQLQAQLLFNAFLKAYDGYLQKEFIGE